jgi:hypothetical protein
MATLTRQQIVTAGLLATYSSAGVSGDVVDNRDGKTLLHVKNASAGAITVTITAQDTSTPVAGYGDLTVSDITVSVGAAAEKFIGPFPRNAYNNSSDQIAVSYSAVTSVTVAAVYIDKQPV